MEENPVRGTCLLMCPEKEMEMRQREGLLHVLETRPGRQTAADRHRMVKMFSRSAAGREMLRPEELRPLPVLKKTVNYLLSTVVCEEHVPWSTVYTFVTDRLRAVRQDMVIQQPPASVCASILEPIVRFHAYAAYRMCEEPLEMFDPHLNATALNESLKQLLVSYDDAGDAWSGSRDQMEALYGLLHLGDPEALHRMVSLQTDTGPAPPSRDCLVHVALRASVAHFHNNYVRVCRLLRDLPTLLTCVAATHLPSVRRRALCVMATAYSSKTLRFPLRSLGSLLLFPDQAAAARECRHYDLQVDEEGVAFLRGSFNAAKEQCKPRRLPFLDKDLNNISLPQLLLTADTVEEY